MTVTVPAMKEKESKPVNLMQGFLLVVAYAVFCAEIFLMVFCMSKVSYLAAMAYDYITLPQALHFVTSFKWLFEALIFVLTCVPGALLILVTEIIMSKFAKR